MRNVLLTLLVLASPALWATEPPTAGLPTACDAVQAQPPADDPLAELFAPEAEDLGTFITWSGGTCTAWLYCPGEPYWKCQSTTGNCQHDGCSITCNGNTRSCRGPCIPF